MRVRSLGIAALALVSIPLAACTSPSRMSINGGPATSSAPTEHRYRYSTMVVQFQPTRPLEPETV